MTTAPSFFPVPLGLDNYLDDTVLGRMIEDVESSGADVVAFYVSHGVVLAPVTPPHEGVGGCFACLARRWQILRVEEERNTLESGGEMLAVDPLFLTEEPFKSIIDSTINAMPSEWPCSPKGYTKVYSFKADSVEFSSFPLIADSGCPRCFSMNACPENASEIRPQPRLKESVEDSRTTKVRDYGIEPDAFANPICGMLGPVAGRGYDSTSTAMVTGYHRVRGDFNELHEFFWSGHANNFEDSTLLAILEGLERHSGLIPRRYEPAMVASYSSVKDRAIDPRAVTLFPSEFYKYLPHRFTEFTEHLEIPWVWAWSLRDSRPLLVPLIFSYYLNADASTNFVAECSNGCATGGSLEEAALFGLMELIERDAFVTAWFSKAPLPEIDVAAIREDDVRHMINRLAMQGYDVRAFDNRVDLPFPVVSAVAVRRDGGQGALCYAAGSGFNPIDAFRGALCEIASYVPGFEDRIIANKELIDSIMRDYRKCTELKHHALLHGAPEMRWASDFLLNQDRPVHSLDELYADWNDSRPRTLDLAEDLKFVVTTLADKGLDTLIVDQTSPEQETLNLSTVSTIVPGLVPIDFGWTMQRGLFMPRVRNAPVEAGWFDAPLKYEDLNPVPHPFP